MMRELEQIKALAKPQEILLIADAATGQEAVNVAKGFHERVNVTGLILTKVDGDARGAAISMREVTGVPIKYLATGEKLDGLEPFHPDRLATRILGMGDMLTLIEKAGENVDKADAERMSRKLVKGEFNLRTSEPAPADQEDGAAHAVAGHDPRHGAHDPGARQDGRTSSSGRSKPSSTR